MKVTEEVDALRTIGIGPMELLVLRKMLALMIALPLLTVFTDVTGILGGMVMARAHLDVSFSTFLSRLDDAISLTSYLIGIGKAPVFAVIISLVGCYQGFLGHRQRRQRRPADHGERGAVDFPGDRDRFAVFDHLQFAGDLSKAMAQAQPVAPVIDIRGLNTRFGSAVVHENVSLAVRPGEIFALVGASGCGKSTLLRETIALQQPVSGSIRVFGQEVIGLNDEEALPLRRRWGVMFERGALFSSLTVTENVAMVLQEHTALSDRLMDEIAAVKIALSDGTGAATLRTMVLRNAEFLDIRGNYTKATQTAQLYGPYCAAIHHFHISDNTCVGSDQTPNAEYGVYIVDTACTYGHIHSNLFKAVSGTLTHGVYSFDKLSYGRVYNNRGNGVTYPETIVTTTNNTCGPYFGVATSIADGGTIAHGLNFVPTWAIVTPTSPADMVSVTGLSDTTITVAVKHHDAGPGVTQTLYWMCGT